MRSLVSSGAGCSGRDPADAVPLFSNVPRPAASSFISRKGVQRHRDRYAAQSLIAVDPERAQVDRASGASRSETKEEGRSPGGHSRREVPGVLFTRPERQCAQPNTQPAMDH
jgi:hypothetical protein